ncbi:MAG: adenylate/guanylate cyclase domain-containing protein [Cellvibrionaceae bacterium]
MSDIENLTIMFTDIVGFSNMVSSLPRTESEQILQTHDKLLQKQIKRFGGTIIKSVGDSFLVIFRSPTDAVLCSMAMQDTLWEQNQADDNQHDIIIRVALNAGEVRLTHGDVFGEAVNIAARLEGETPAGDIYLTETVYLSMNKNEVHLEEVGKKDFKGIPQAITIYQANNKADKEQSVEFKDYPYGGSHKRLKPASRSLFSVGKLFVGISTAIIAAFFSWWLTITYMPSTGTIELDKLEVAYKDPSQINEYDVISFMPDITTEIRNKAEPLVESKNYVSLKTLVDEYTTDYPDNPYLSMLKGHISIYYENYEPAINQYEAALKENSSLARDVQLSKNLVKLLDYQRIKANRLLAQHLSPAMVNALSARTGKSGLRARYDAFYLLKDSGNLKKVDTVGLNIWDLKELNECKLKKIAVRELKRLNDPRALPTLKKIASSNIWKQIQYFCLRADVRKAIAQIEGKDKKTVEDNKDEKTPIKKQTNSDEAIKTDE